MRYDTNALKPCPFCGSVNIEVRSCLGMYDAHCEYCELETRPFSSVDKLIEYWNRRFDNG